MCKFDLNKIIVMILIVSISVVLFCETLAEPPVNYGERTAGTVENPFLIDSLANLRWLSESPEYWGTQERPLHFVQTSNIDAEETRRWNEGSGFLPIGRRTLIPIQPPAHLLIPPFSV